MSQQVGEIMNNPQSNGKRKVFSNQNKMATGGKLPPQALDMEEAVLGALMLQKDPVNDVIDILQPESFYKEAHSKIFEAIKELFGESEPIDILTVTQRLRQKGEIDQVGGPFYISQLTNRVASTANTEAHARVISQKYILRELIKVSSNVINKAFDETTDVFDLLDEAESALFKVAEGNIRKNYDSMKDLVYQAGKEIEKAMEQEDGVSGIPSGFHDLDRVTAGWQRSDMVVIAARPGMGKTAFVLSLARNVAVQFGHPCAVFSLEMSSLQLVNRLISGESEIPAEDIRKGNFTKEKFNMFFERTKKLSEAPLFIDDTPGLSVFELRAKCRRLKAQHEIDLVVIDYLQLMSAGGSGGNREQEISTISRSIKEIAKELNVPVLALSQLSRSVESRGGDKRPMLSDLRESGAIEQDADIVCFIYRPEYYQLDTWPDNTPCAGQGEIIIAKHRNGSLEDVRLKFIGKFAKFDNLDSFDTEYNTAALDSVQGGEDFDDGGMGGGGAMTLPSKMNDDFDNFDDDFSGGDNTPF